MATHCSILASKIPWTEKPVGLQSMGSQRDTTEAPQHTCISDLNVYVIACMHAQLLSYVRLFVTPWTVAHQAPLSMKFSKQEYWSGLPFPPPGYLLESRVEPTSPAFPALASSFFTTVPTGKPMYVFTFVKYKCYYALCVIPANTALHGMNIQ